MPASIAPTDSQRVRGARARGAGVALLALALVVAGVAGYFVLALGLGPRLPLLRNHAVPSWILVGSGVVLALAAVRRAPRGRRLVPGAVLGVNALLAAAFATFLHVLLAVPEARSVAVGTAAPVFALSDQAGRTVRLDDYRGRPLLLVFYRGHW